MKYHLPRRIQISAPPTPWWDREWFRATIEFAVLSIAIGCFIWLAMVTA